MFNLTFLHVHVHMRVTNYRSLIAAAVYCTNLSSRYNVDTWIIVRLRNTSGSFLLIGELIILILGPGLSVLVTIDRVGCQITATVQLLNMDRLATVLIYIHGYGTVNDTAGVVTAKYLLERTVGNINGYIVVDIGITCTTVYVIHVLYAVKCHVDFTVHLGVLTATVGFVNLDLALRSILIY